MVRKMFENYLFGLKIQIYLNKKIFSSISVLFAAWEVYLELCQTTKTELFAKIVNDLKPLKPFPQKTTP